MTDNSRDGDAAAEADRAASAPARTRAPDEGGGGAELSRTVNLDLGNMAELNMVAINAAHIVSVRLTGAYNSAIRKMEVALANGSVIGMSFDDPDHAEAVFGQVVATINRTIPDHRAREVIVVPQNTVSP